MKKKKVTEDVYIILYLHLSCAKILGKSFRLSESMSHMPHQSRRHLPSSLPQAFSICIPL